MNTIERNELLTALYQVTSKADLLKQFDSMLSGAKGVKGNRYSHLLEQILFYSHAIIFGHGVQTAHNYRQAFMTTAKKSKLLKLSDEEIETAFSFLNRTEKKSIIKATSTEPQNQKNNASSKASNACTAKDEINRLKAQLDNKTYELAKGQKEEDKQAFIKISLVALSTGARLKDIMEDMTVSTKKGVTYFNDEEGIILELDTKAVQGYLKAIRSHYKERIEQGTDISTGIRKAVKRLNIPNCGNTNNLNSLYRECLTSSPQK
jgi:hypothetical protein